MLHRACILTLLGCFTITLGIGSSFGQEPAYNKKTIATLSKRIDEHLAKVWAKAKVSPAAKADDFVYFRRLNLDLRGRIPELSDVVDFVDDDDAEKRWLWVDRMLESQEYPAHFAHVWRNIMLGYQSNPQFQFLMPQFEGWLRERIKDNVALDAMALQLLTSQVGGQNMGFGRGGMGTTSPQLFFQANENKAELLAAATSRVFLGVKIECAQCHAHPFAKWKQDQFWEFAAFYSQTPQIIRQPNQPAPAKLPSITPGREILIPGTERVVKAKFLNGKMPDWESSTNSRKTLADWIVAKENPYFAKTMADHVWSYLMGVSLLEPINEPSDDIPLTHPELLDDLAKALVANNFDARFLVRAIVHSQAYQRGNGGAKLADKEDYHLFVRMPIRSLSPEQIFDSVVVATVSPHEIETRRSLLGQPNQPQQFFDPRFQQSERAKFALKFPMQDRRYEPQTSILQALFMMNGEFLRKRTNATNNKDLKTLANPNLRDGHPARVMSLYRMVLSRPARPDEIARLVPYLERGGATKNLGDAVSDIYWALLNSSEFLHNH